MSCDPKSYKQFQENIASVVCPRNDSKCVEWITNPSTTYKDICRGSFFNEYVANQTLFTPLQFFEQCYFQKLTQKNCELFGRDKDRDYYILQKQRLLPSK